MREGKGLLCAMLFLLGACVQPSAQSKMEVAPPADGLQAADAAMADALPGPLEDHWAFDDNRQVPGDAAVETADLLPSEDALDTTPDVGPVCPNQAPCDDGDPCTSAETCISGICQPGAVDQTLNCLYADKPGISSCSSGTASDAAQAVALSRVNMVRALSGLPAVTYDAKSDPETQDAALMMTANNELNHEPPANWYCWTEAGFVGAGASNLHRGWSTDLKLPDPLEAVDAFLVDINVESLGHRRWLLDPFLTQVSYGAAHGKSKVVSSYPYGRAMALKVIYPNPKPTAFQGDFVAYPHGDYPAGLVEKDWYLSFSMVANKTSKWANEKVDLTSAVVTVEGPGQYKLPVHDMVASNQFFGLPNHLKWKVSGLQNNVEYNVYIDGLKYAGKGHSFHYTFRLIP